MAGPTVRTLRRDELPEGGRVVAYGMLGSLDPTLIAGWTEHWEPERTHGAFAGDELVGVCRWFPGDLSVPGATVPAALVSAVAVLSTHRRQGHLRRMMLAELESMVAEERAVATLLAAEWPIYGRYGYGPAVPGCTLVIDTASARLRAEPTGSIALVSAEELRPHLEACHDAAAARRPGAVTRLPDSWDRIAGVVPWPGAKDDQGLRRGALWRDDAGRVLGAVEYVVAEEWTDNRPRGRAEVSLLVGATAEAERELWRHLIELDWVATVKAGPRPLDDPLPLLLDDARAVAPRDVSDHVWTRILDLPATFRAYRPTMAGTAVVEVLDPLGYAAGRWQLDLSPEGSTVTATSAEPDVVLPVTALSAAHLGGHSIATLHGAGWLDEGRPGGVARTGALLATPTAPWSPTSY